jgi:uncharacterized membrane protein YjgN (DUF898 family)
MFLRDFGIASLVAVILFGVIRPWAHEELKKFIKPKKEE